jgi:putative ABC transport system ATP-binding protein
MIPFYLPKRPTISDYSASMPQQGKLLEGDHLGRRHPGGHAWLLDDVTLAIESGSRVVLTGPSGGGKTLLLRALARLDPLDRGEVRYLGQSIQGDAVPAYRAHVMYLHQRAALIEETVEAALRMPFSLRVHRQRRFDRGRASELFFGLGRGTDFLEKKVADLSGGEIQLTALVRGLQLNPTILLLDEPTSALDGPTAAAVEDLIDRWLAENSERAMIWVSHNEAQAQRVGRTAIRMEAGRLTNS